MKRRIWWKIPLLSLVLIGVFAAAAYAAGAAAPLKAADMLLYIDGQTTLSLGSDTVQMEAALGKEYSLERLPSCLYEGEDHIYSFEGLTVYSHPEGDAQIIDEMRVTGQSYPTRRGVWVGTPVAEVIERYGRQYEKMDNTMSYYITKQMRIIFTIENGVVESYSLYNVPIS